MGRRITLTAERAVAGSANGELVPEGWYDAVIEATEDVQVKNGENKGSPMIKTRFKITGPEQVGRVATKWVCLFPGKDGKALITYYQLAAAVGHPVEFDEGKQTAEFEVLDDDELIGKPVQIKIVHEPGQDGDTENMTYSVNRIKAPRDGVDGVVMAAKGGGKPGRKRIGL